MDEQAAWENFQRTGSVIDYLQYRAIYQQNHFQSPQEDVYADQHRRPDHPGNEYR